MARHNPKYILRNYLAQQVIMQAEQGSPGPLDSLLNVLQRPFDEHPSAHHYADPIPDWAEQICVSCSS
ncbi:MAG: hypothetical protein V7752_12140 [Halopseudomonas sp.]